MSVRKIELFSVKMREDAIEAGIGLVITIISSHSIIFLLTKLGYSLRVEHALAVYGTVILGVTLFYHGRVSLRNHAREMDFFLANSLNHWIIDLADSVNCSRMFWDNHPEFMKDITGGHLAIKYLKEEKEKNQRERKAVVSILNYLEHMSILVKNGTINEDKLKDRMQTTFDNYYDRCIYFIEARRKEDNDKVGLNYREFENLALKWQR